MMFGAWGNPDHDDSIRIIHRALDAGINFVDTADVYSAGESEEIARTARAGPPRDTAPLATNLHGGARSRGVRRGDVVLATKFHGGMGEDPNMQGHSRRWIVRGVEKSLGRL